MYLEHFGLGVNPFSLSPKLDFLYQSETFGESMAHLIYGVDNQEAIVLVTGPIGTGKTMALQSFLTNLGTKFEFALVTNTRVSALELLKLVLEDLGVDFPPGADKSDLLILFKKFLQTSSRRGKTVLLVIDEAQNLSADILEELRLLTNLGQGEIQPVQIILVGQPELEAVVNRPDMEQIRQRIRVHYILAPLTRQETGEYLAHRMSIAGCETQVFTKSAIDRIYDLSRGVPRLVNTLAGDALLSAFVGGRSSVRPDDVTGPEDETERRQAEPASLPVPPDPVQPVEMTPGGPVFADSVPPPTMARRAPRRRSRRPLWGLVGAVVVLGILGILFTQGYFADLLAPAAPVPETVAATPVSQPVAESPAPAAIPDTVLTGAAAADILPTEPQDQTETATVTSAVPARAGQTGTPAEAGVFLHICSFRSHERATNFADSWTGPFGRPTVRVERIFRDIWNRVYLGPFASRSEADTEGLRLKQDGAISYYMVKELPLQVGS